MTIDLTIIKSRLETKKSELLANIASQTEANPTPVSPIEASEGPLCWVCLVVFVLETTNERSVVVNDKVILDEVNQALKRIHDGTYGKCVNCGNPIPELRLEAIPWAARDVKCEAQLEQRNPTDET